MNKQPVTYQPGLSVTLTKVIKYRNGQAGRYTAANNTIDLTKFLGSEGAGVSTTKDVRQPCGSFSITFPDKLDQKTQDTLYAAISPMDYIEIRMARSSQNYSTGSLPIVMRGFVSSVKRKQEMGDDGKPRRFVTVTGMDFGKLLGMIQIFYEQNYGLGQNLLTVFRLFANSGVGGSAIPASNFLQSILDNIINPYLDTFYQKSALAGTTQNPFQIRSAASAVKEGVIQPYSFQSYEGDLWGLLKGFSDLNWNEMFVQDREDGPYLVYRPLPFKDINGNFIGGAADPGSTVITPADIKTIDLERSDKGVANYFWVNAPQFQLVDHGTLQMDAYNRKQDYFIQDRPNCDPILYGIRKMQVDTGQGNTDETTSGAHQENTQQAKSNAFAENWVDTRRNVLKEINQDNVIFEEGEMVLKGNEAIMPGTTVIVDYGSYRAEHYAFAVSQNFMPLSSYTTRVQVSRGTGYIERTKLTGSPYISERSRGVYGS